MAVSDWERMLEGIDEGALVLADGKTITKSQADELFLQYFMLQEQAEIFKNELENAMLENGITKWETDDFVVRLGENKPSRKLDMEKVRKTIEVDIGESLEDYYKETKVTKPYRLTIIDKAKAERRGR